MAETRIDHQQLRNLASELLMAAGTDVSEATVIADNLVWADLMGRFTQGVWRLTVLLPRLRSGLIHSPCLPKFIQKADGVMIVDGNNGFGHYIGHVAMTKAIELAQCHGTGLAAVRNSNHFGAGAYYVELAAQAGMLGFAFTNATRRVAAYGGLSPLFGTNPVCFGAPLQNGESVLIDFSTGAMAGSVIRKATETGEPIPEGVAIDEYGNPITTPQQAQGSTLLPFGGARGYCLSLLVEILTGVLTNSLMSFQIPTMHEKEQIASQIGHFFFVIDITRLLPLEEYYQRIKMLIIEVKKSKLQTGVTEILIPGETRWRNYADQLREGIRLDWKTAESLKSIANELKVATPW
ncbi:Ldh family oxidoreductase [Tumidithrix elongata RA019]|uniref:Ldh family oxidoreductase n=1 Tax=Tumidithrix elongata BACA0141 TaxID=2716417 RepID=A0AAW9PR71_9CYAN|nr:Ldh family oxidoreductase [Tumidithrix elongata RA019]